MIAPLDTTGGTQDWQAASCPVCRANDCPFYAVCGDRLFGLTAQKYQLRRCNSCRCIFQHPLPGERELKASYPEQYWWDEERNSPNSTHKVLARLEQMYREWVIRDHVKYVEARVAGVRGRVPRLLDIGCGSGLFLAAMRRKGFEVFGMDLSERAVAAARMQYGLEVYQGGIGSQMWQKTRFDIITMFHVLEHVRNPVDALRYAGGLLSPSGRLILQVPNTASIQARLLGPRWYGLDVPRHVINFGTESLKFVLHEAGFSGIPVTRFSLRDNPAALASSLIPALDPIGRKGRKRDRTTPVAAVMAELAYLALFGAAVPFTFIESIAGAGATLWVEAKPGAGG